MRCILWYFLIVIVFASCQKATTGDILIEDVNIIDLASGNVIDHQDVVITGARISHIANHESGKILTQTTIDGHGKFLMPGLWDMHVHMMRNKWYESQMPLMIANGITGFREMWGDLSIAKQVDSKMERDSLPTFRYTMSGHILDGKKPFWRNSLSAATADEGIAMVDSLANADADFVKVYSFLAPDVFQAIAKRCNELSLPFAGHVPHSVRLREASAAGMASMEHLYGFLIESCSDSDSAMAIMRQSVAAFESGTKEERKRVTSRFHSFVLKNFDRQKLIDACAILKTNNTHIVPTLTTLKGIYFINDTSFTNDPRKIHLSDETLDYWREMEEEDLKDNSPQDWKDKRQRWEVEQQIMRILISENVTIMAGTDTDNPYAFPGFSLHDELAAHVELGMKPIDALRSATTVPVKFLGLSDSLGRIEQGYLADLVILDANPLTDITNTRKVIVVVANGKVYDNSYIESVLKGREKVKL